MAPIEYYLDEHVAVLTMKDGENRFNYDFLDLFMKTLDEIERGTDARTLVVTSAHEKIFCNGIDLEWLGGLIAREGRQAALEFPKRLNALLRRILTYPLITVAAINGHAFAGGAIMACCFDFRFMRTQRGFFCVPEVDIGIPFMPGMSAMMKKAIPMYKVMEMQLTGKRVTAEECEAHHIVVKACPVETLLEEALAFAMTHKKDRRMLGVMKNVLFKDLLQIMDVDDPAYLAGGQTGL